MKQIAAFTVAAALLLCLFTGCASPAGNASALSQTASVQATEAQPWDPAREIAQAELRAGRHEREDGYQDPFNTQSIDTSFATVHMEESVFEESALREAAALIAADISTLTDRLGEAPDKVTLYLTQRMDRPACLNGHVVCTPDDLKSGAYREALCGAGYGLSSPWKQIGLSAFVFGSVDETGLAAYYADEAHALTASCAAVYLLPDFADAETVDAARKTAQSITAWLMKNGGLSALRDAAGTAESLPAWQAGLGIETPLVLPEGSEKADTMTTEDNRSFHCTVHTENITIRVEAGSQVDSPDALYQFVCSLWSGVDVEFDTIRTELPGLLTLAEERFAEPITIRFVSSGVGNYTYGYKIDLRNSSTVWHELMHVMLAASYEDKENFWLCEGIAEALSADGMSYAMQYPELTDEDFTLTDDKQNEAKQKVRESEKNIYFSLRAQRDDRLNGLYDYGAEEFAIGVCRMLLDDPFERTMTVGDVRGYGYEGGPKETDGRSLTYPEAVVLFRYLAETYGAEAVVRANLDDKSMTEAFGKEYPELYADCVAYLNEHYGSLLAVSN